MDDPGHADDPGRVRSASIAVAVAFAANGVLFSSWASRIPQVRDLLGLTPAALGLAIMSIAVGSAVALPLSGLIVHRLGPTRVVAAGGAGAGVGLVAVALGVLIGLPVVVVGLVVIGFAVSVWDVAQNVEGAAVEHRRGVPLMPRFHALFSLGTVAGALVGVAMNALGVPVTAHLAAIAILCTAACGLASRSFLTGVEEQAQAGAGAALRRAWREPRTLLIGVFALALSFAEGAGMDWIAVAAVDGYAAPAALASVTYAVFVAGLTLTRWFGTRALERYGRVACLRAGAVSSLVGVLVVVLGGSLAVFLLGAFLWGAGVALGMPVSMSAAADDQRRAAARVSVVATIGYSAFLAGPTLIGVVGDRTGVLRALLLVPVALAAAYLAAAATRPLPARTD